MYKKNVGVKKIVFKVHCRGFILKFLIVMLSFATPFLRTIAKKLPKNQLTSSFVKLEKAMTLSR
jgi:hypothetical protein